ncbi:hypothetical protein C900_00882 [Fulvivirga imtechensis AK7]|uniref:Uncharacterized protein n=1 Tax=Fulvivirga imtechensis AK7 TaxID=1237149 RepID=L8JV68_9BACT|nr:hypothetical protein C900_00882 [Fulvivirga imtechensis AK7]
MVTGKRVADVQRSVIYDRRSIKLYRRSYEFMEVQANIVSVKKPVLGIFPLSPV